MRIPRCVEHRADVLAHEVDTENGNRANALLGHRDRPVGHRKRIGHVNVRPIAGGEHALQLRVHVEVSDDAGVLLAEQRGQPHDELRVRLQKGGLGLGERPLGISASAVIRSEGNTGRVICDQLQKAEYTSCPAPRMSSEPTQTSVYVHFPWCARKCPYCDFATEPIRANALPHEEYADAVLRELEARAADLQGRALKSIFFGGGTPSLWGPNALRRTLAGITGAFDRVHEISRSPWNAIQAR